MQHRIPRVAHDCHVGFIGLGRLGAQLVDGCVDAGFASLTLFDVRAEVLAPFVERGAKGASSVAEIAVGDPDVVGVCVQNDDQLKDVVAGPDGLLAAGLPPGAVIAVHSTVHPSTCMKLAERAAAAGVCLVDAAITNGGRVPGGRRTRVVLAGGDREVVAACEPYFTAFGDVVEHAGETGSGQVVKLLNNLLLVVNMAMAHRTLEAGRQLGVDLDVLTRVLSVGSGSSQGVQTLLATERAAHNSILLGKDVGLATDVIGAGGLDTADLVSAGARGVEILVSTAERVGETATGLGGQ